MKKANDTNLNLIIPKGTQIVLLNETKVPNENHFYAKVTVGKIVGLPVDAFHAYKIEFPDGGLGMANRRDFSIRKEFQIEQSGLISPLEDYQLFDYVIYRCVVGSKAFGLDDANSDTDRRGIYLPPAEVQWSMFGVPEQIESKETEECYWKLRKFLILALKANPNILECLFTPLLEYQSELAEELLSMRKIFFFEARLSNLQRLCDVAIQKTRRGFASHGRDKMETRDALDSASFAGHRNFARIRFKRSRRSESPNSAFDKARRNRLAQSE